MVYTYILYYTYTTMWLQTMEESFQYISMDSVLLEPDDTKDQELYSSELHNPDMILPESQAGPINASQKRSISLRNKGR